MLIMFQRQWVERGGKIEEKTERRRQKKEDELMKRRQRGGVKDERCLL
jgi:hypothetical protein